MQAGSVSLFYWKIFKNIGQNEKCTICNTYILLHVVSQVSILIKKWEKLLFNVRYYMFFFSILGIHIIYIKYEWFFK